MGNPAGMSGPPPDPAIAPAAAPAAGPPSLIELFVAFGTVSLSGFGGVLAWSRRIVVERRRWMTAEEFNEAYALCQFLPGPNIVNFAAVFGSRIRGARGAAVALLGLLGPPFLIVTFFGFLYFQYGEIAALARMLAGIAAAAAGLLIGTTVKMAEPLLRRGLSGGVFVALAVLVAIGIVRWPMWWVLAVLMPASIAIAWWERR